MYQGKVRVRVCGLLIESNKMLLLKHEGLGPKGHLWSPPGGGIEFGDESKARLKKEFLEETGLEIAIHRFLFINEHIDDQHHAIELFFSVQQVSGKVRLGADPEQEKQILTDLKFLSLEEIQALPSGTAHALFSSITTFEDIYELSGYYKFAQF